ncbi:MAG: hypothetical protein A3I81_05850 [Deltaproteobacteria bacterium RIFCSPLOWO2_02_FULL_55_12]|nr:MAG: hypothetical protein A3I81_05850 [Deltaproteobacteria bacterium RIFCSPLOWO2_02_FULL_55_12]
MVVCREKHMGADVIRTYVYASPGKTPTSRLVNHLSFAFCALLGLLFVKRPDVILLTMPPLFLGATGLAFKLLMRRPLILDVRDLWPQAAVDLGEMKESFLTRALTRLELFFYGKSDRVTVVTRGILKSLISRKVPEWKVNLVTNGVNTDVFDLAERGPNPYESLGLAGKFIIVYAGVIGVQHGTAFVARAASLLSGQRDIAFVFIGEGVKKRELKTEAERLGLDNIHFISDQPVEALARFLGHSHAGLATLRDLPFCDGVILVKMFCYMACSLPVVLAGRGESKGILDEAEAGVCVEPEDPARLAEAVTTLYNDRELGRRLGAHGRRYVEERYSRRLSADKMEEVINEAVRPR